MKLKKIAAMLAVAGLSVPAFATNGYFAHGIGVKAKAMGGASIAYAEDGMGIASNPATLSQSATGLTIGASLFAPKRSVGTSANYPTPNWTKDGDGSGTFVIPELAYVARGNDGLTYGVAVYGNGGMNTDYGKPMYDASRNTYSNLEQLFIAPTIAKKINDQHTLALSLNIVQQTFEARGLNWFAQYTRSAQFLAPVTLANPFGYSGGGVDPGNHGKDTSTGVGVKLGWTGQMSKDFSMGAFYQPKTGMSKFSAYKDLFAEDGKFDIPESYGLGMSLAATPRTTVLLDVVQINYKEIKSLSNKNNHNAFNTKLGAADGKGFGWSDMTVYKLGLRHQMDDNTVLRAGWNYGKQPISSDQLDFNLLAPAVVEQHLTLGLTRKLDSKSEISAHYMHAFKNDLSGAPTQGTGTYYMKALNMSQDEFGIQYSTKF